VRRILCSCPIYPHAFAEHAARLAPQTEVQVLQPGEWTTLN
jgi:hypothetical protein